VLEVKVLKQKIKVQNQCYELQEIYGLEPKQQSTTNEGGDDDDNNTTTNTNSSTSTGASSANRNGDGALQTQECVICMTNPRMSSRPQISHFVFFVLIVSLLGY
jgi:hypothetical protein